MLFHVVTLLGIRVVWDVTLCCSSHRFEELYCLHLHSQAVKKNSQPEKRML